MFAFLFRYCSGMGESSITSHHRFSQVHTFVSKFPIANLTILKQRPQRLQRKFQFRNDKSDSQDRSENLAISQVCFHDEQMLPYFSTSRPTQLHSGYLYQCLCSCVWRGVWPLWAPLKPPPVLCFKGYSYICPSLMLEECFLLDTEMDALFSAPLMARIDNILRYIFSKVYETSWTHRLRTFLHSFGVSLPNSPKYKSIDNCTDTLTNKHLYLYR